MTSPMHSTRAARSRSMSNTEAPPSAIGTPSRGGSAGPRPAQHNVERAGAAIARLGRRDAEKVGAKLRLFEPARHRRAQDAALGAFARAAAGDDENATLAVAARRAEKVCQRAVRLALGHAVQIEPGF